MGDERRRWARIEAGLECNVATAAKTFEARVVNLSRSGVALMAPVGLTTIGETVTVLIERGIELALGLSGTVVRIVGAADETVYGVHFDPLPPDTEEQVLALLKLLAEGKGHGRREHPRVATRIAVSCRTKERFSALLNDLSRGGMSIRCPRSVEAGAQLTVELGVGANPELLVIEGTVTHVEVLPDGKNIAGLQFTPPSEEIRDRVQQLLELLLGIESDE